MAGAARNPANDLVVLGANHASAGPALRDRLFAMEPDPAPLLARLRDAGARQALVLATCERMEAVSFATDPALSTGALADVVAAAAGLDADEAREQMFHLEGAAALRHLFAVTASLDSRVAGEPHILGQVKECHRRAEQAGLIGPALGSILRAAYATAKRVRRETPIAQGPVSIAAAALLVARDVHGELGGRAALLIGLGEMGEFMAAELKGAGIRDLVVTHASPARAEAAARHLGCHVRPWDELDEALVSADIVVSALGTGRFTMTAARAEAALARRRRAAMFVIDTAVPRDVEPAVNDLDGAYVYDLDDLERVALRGRASREGALAAAWDILEADLDSFLRHAAGRSASASIAALRRHFEAARADVLAAGDLSAAEATRRLINRLLHAPSRALRDSAAGDDIGGEGSLAAALRRAFGIAEGAQTRGRDGRSDPEQEEDK